MSKFISDITHQSRHRWPSILTALDIPGLPGGKHGPCPLCGGKDRFRFDDKKGRGTWFCNYCGHGDGLDLVTLVRQCDLIQAAREISRLTDVTPTAPAKERTKPPSHADITQKVAALLATCTQGTSDYLLHKGLAQRGFLMPANSAKNIGGVHFNVGSMVLPLVDLSGNTTGALLINRRGEKRLLPGSRIKSSFIPITNHALSQTIIITEGFATGLVISRFVAVTVVAAISANNLTHVAVALRERYPDAQIILAADNDVTDSDHNPGKQQAEHAALVVNGLVTLPPTGDKADWDDYRQQVGTDTARIEFFRQLYNPKEWI
ncbi:putative prophage DNA primase [Yersinia intermedia]|uniref:primase-helicase zinc-binding domain-containing protein n=1 Tax=Yersinia intermedia TaxID=631 RepID=UPI0005DAE4F9|nr:primase-helicase zinc-binding domain-containing protein [Yersinia intermedia]MDA5510791.1 toprim domain-containing protein [Yersinia intermedia]CNI64134.1 putative prophage DNA primase [Yersinia intermedia]CQD84783.1 putative prophage DNA primase [Yersinia intermedia]